MVTEQIPFVDYLVLGELPHLIAHECTTCSARFFSHRNACASCGSLTFHDVVIGSVGELRSFTIVAFAAPGVEVPFVAGVIDCGGTTVRGNIVNVSPDPDHVSLGMRVKLTTFGLGEDSAGVEAIGYGF